VASGLNNLPPQLIRSVNESRCLLFFGSGMSQGAGLPSTIEIANLLANELHADFQRDSKFKDRLGELESCRNNLRRIAQLSTDYYKSRRAYERVAEVLDTAERAAKIEVFRPLQALPTIREILTTNYDLLVEHSLDPNDYHVIYRESDMRQAAGPRLRIVKLHGTRTDVASLILTDKDYHSFQEKHRPLVELTKTLLRQKTLIVVGYSLEDENFAAILESIGNSGDVLNYFVSPTDSLYQTLHWARQGFEHLALDGEQFLQILADSFASLHYEEETASFPEPSNSARPVEPLNNPFVLYDTEALIEEKPEFLSETFVNPVEFPKILEHRHTIIEGHRGSGKSTILWRMSLAARAYGKSVDLPMWGFYIKMVPGLFTAFRRPRKADRTWANTDEEWLRDFTHYFNLIVLDGVLQNLEGALSRNVLQANRELGAVIREIAQRLLRLPEHERTTDMRSLRRMIEESLDTILNATPSPSFFTGPTFLTRALDLLQDAIPSLGQKWWCILLDEYDNVYQEQQAVVNVLIRERHPKLRFKLAAKTLHVHLSDLSGRSLEPTNDFGYVPCDSFIWDRRLKEQYITFLEEISNRRLKQAGQKHITVRQLLPDPQDADENYYAGFETYCLLSSGLTRQFIELSKDAIYEAFPETALARVELKPIPARLQHHVARVHSAILFKNYRSSRQPRRVFRIFRVLGPLFRGIAKVTSNQTEYRNPLSFEIVDLDLLSEETLEVLEDAIRCRLLQFPTVPKKPHNPLKEGPAQKYSLHRLLAPLFGLSLRERYTVPIHASDINRIWQHPEDVLQKLAASYKAKGIQKHLDSILPLFEEGHRDVF
jgi:hypothetical protein